MYFELKFNQKYSLNFKACPTELYKAMNRPEADFAVLYIAESTPVMEKVVSQFARTDLFTC